MILAAGRGVRMRPLSDTTPKPLLRVGGKSLIEWQIERLVAAGFTDIVINHAWLGDQIEAALGTGRALGANIRYSAEGEALETVGGIVKALPLLGDQPFVVASGDVFTDFPYASLHARLARIVANHPDEVGHVVLTDNPPFHPRGDMAIAAGKAVMEGERLNYGGIAVFHPRIFASFPAGHQGRLFPWAFEHVRAGRVTAEHHRGWWDNVGTPEDLAALNSAWARATDARRQQA
ncbi:MAG: nucleotidyltransferase family protein [Betaproteobacteria bacterium]|nr:nucleotidyltransferase family protein [Betaproteobacteria bacterium]